MLFCADHGLKLEIEHVDLMSDQQKSQAYLAINPNGIVPFLDDDGFCLGESSAILKYLAEKFGSPTYPSELKARARVNEALDWFNTNFHEYFCLFTIYPNFGVPHGLDPAIGQGVIAYGEQASVKWLKILDEQMIGSKRFVCGDQISLADYLGSAFVTLGEAVSYDLSPYPNIRRWLATMKALPSWDATYAGFYGMVTALQSQSQIPA